MKKRLRRKVWPLSNCLAIALEGCSVMQPAKLSQLELLELQSVEAFRVGNAGLSDWKAMADMLNLAETMAKDGIGPELIPVCNEVQERLIECKSDLSVLGKWVLLRLV